MHTAAAAREYAHAKCERHLPPGYSPVSRPTWECRFAGTPLPVGASAGTRLSWILVSGQVLWTKAPGQPLHRTSSASSTNLGRSQIVVSDVIILPWSMPSVDHDVFKFTALALI